MCRTSIGSKGAATGAGFRPRANAAPITARCASKAKARLIRLKTVFSTARALEELAVDGPDETALPANDASPTLLQPASPQEAVASGAPLIQTSMSSELKLLAPRRQSAQDSAAQAQDRARQTCRRGQRRLARGCAGIKPDFDLLSQNLARLATQGAKVLGAFLEPYEKGRARNDMAEQIVDAVQSFGRIAEYWLGDPTRTVEAQKSLSTNFLSLWAHTLRRLSGEAEEPIVPFDPSDRRYTAPQWRSSAIFDFLRQAHAITSDWAGNLIARAETDPEIRAKAEFYLRQITSALSPSNFVATNPELLRETLASNAENLVRGTTFLAEDLAAGGGTLRIRQSDASPFAFGVNMAASPGKVVYRNDLIELIQYEPTTRGLSPAAPRHSPVDQQILYSRSQSAEELRAFRGGAGLHRLPRLLGQSRRAA